MVVPADLIKRINPDLVFPRFLELLLETQAACRKKGVDYHALSAYRSNAEQMALWAQGRTKPGPIVTRAKGGESVHNVGAACDLCADRDLVAPGLQPSWSPGAYELLKKEGEARGLQVGVPGLSDPGHVQLPLSKKLGRKEAAILKDLKVEFDTGGLPAVWKRLESWGPW